MLSFVKLAYLLPTAFSSDFPFFKLLTMDFIAFDFETANYLPTSACSIGLAVVRNWEVVEEKEFLIKPYPTYFNANNIRVHGITPNKVATAPTFDQLWPVLRGYLEGGLLVAHNAAFDMGVLRQLIGHYGLTTRNIPYYCTLKLARRTWKGMAGYGLSKLSEAFQIALNHHNAKSDAAACAQIMIRVCQQHAVASAEELAEVFGPYGRLNHDQHLPFSIKKPK